MKHSSDQWNAPYKVEFPLKSVAEWNYHKRIQNLLVDLTNQHCGLKYFPVNDMILKIYAPWAHWHIPFTLWPGRRSRRSLTRDGRRRTSEFTIRPFLGYFLLALISRKFVKFVSWKKWNLSLMSDKQVTSSYRIFF